MDALDLLFRRIVLAAQAAGALDRPLTVGALLDQFAPYGAARRDGGVETHDDWLHAMMRLASGERDRFFGDDLMQDDLKAELQSPNPDLSVLRTYANTTLRISTAGVQQVLAGDTAIDLSPPTPPGTGRASGATRTVAGATPRPSGAPAAPGTPGATRATGAHAPLPEPGTEPRPASAVRDAFEAYAGSQAATAGDSAGGPAGETAGETAGTTDPGCPYCAQALPKGRAVKFCPSCGQNLTVRRCPGCSAEIESGWKFCVTCGRKA